MIFCASPDYLKINGMPTTLDELKGHNVLGFTPWFVGSAFKNSFDLAPLAIDSSKLVSNNGNSLRVCAKLGMGIVLQPFPLLEDDLKQGHLVAILEEVKPEPRPIYLIYQSRNLQPIRMTLFINFIKKYKVISGNHLR